MRDAPAACAVAAATLGLVPPRGQRAAGRGGAGGPRRLLLSQTDPAARVLGNKLAGATGKRLRSLASEGGPSVPPRPARGAPELGECRPRAPPPGPPRPRPAGPGPLREGLEATRGGGQRRRERSCKSHDFPAYINHSLFFSTGCRLKGAVSAFSPEGGGGPGVPLTASELGWRGLHRGRCQGSGFKGPPPRTRGWFLLAGDQGRAWKFDLQGTGRAGWRCPPQSSVETGCPC